jgi:ribosomal protein S18 acetylase RimI-like enzyme
VSPTTDIEIRSLGEEFLSDVVRIHQAGLGYSLNSRLGADHLALLYATMARDPNSYVGVALVDRRAAGVITGTVDAHALKIRLLRSLSILGVARLSLKLVTRPRLVLQWWQGNIIDAPVQHEGQDVRAVLTAIAVHPDFQGLGVGKRLVRALEAFFVNAHVMRYRLDTLLRNEPAKEFYKRLGFLEIGIRAGSIVYVKTAGA